MSEKSVPSSTICSERKATQTRTQNRPTSRPMCTAVTLRDDFVSDRYPCGQATAGRPCGLVLRIGLETRSGTFQRTT